MITNGTARSILPLLSIIFCGCISMSSEGTMGLEDLPAFTENDLLRAVIEIPAGSTDKHEYDVATGTFPISTRNGEPRRIRFLPYPANYGFIPGTRMNKDEGGDGDAIDVFVLCHALSTATVLEVEAIGIIELLDAGERDDKVIAIPVDPALRLVDASDVDHLPEGVREILITWLLNYDPEDGAELLAVKGRKEALAAVRRWQVDQP